MADHKNLLLDVPPELADQIARHLPKADLLSLRLVSSNVAARCDRAVVQCIPRTMEIAMCLRETLQTALLVTKNAKWKNAITSVSICLNELTRTAVFGSSTVAQTHIVRSMMDMHSVRRHRPKTSAAFFADQQDQFREGYDTQTIAKILANLAENKAGVEMMLGSWPDIPSKEMKKLHPRTKLLWFTRPQKSDRTSRSVLAALHASGLRPTQLHLEAGALGDCATTITVFRHPAPFVAPGGVLSQLRSLVLTFCTTDLEFAHAEKESVDNFVALLKSCSNTLEVLDLTFSSTPSESRNAVLRHILDTVRLPVLGILGLVGWHADYQTFLYFLERHAKTLTHLYLGSLRLTACGTHLKNAAFESKFKADLARLAISP